MNIYNTNFDFNAYKAFYAVAEHGSFSKAAEILHISQPAISYSIKKLETELNIQLFIRMNKKIQLTEAGCQLKFYLENAFNNIIVGYKVLQESSNQLTGEVTIGIHSHVGTFLLPKYIKQFVKSNPKVKITIFNSTTEDLKKKFRNKEIDILILHYAVFPNDSPYYEKKLFESESCFFSNRYFYETVKNFKKNQLLIECPLILPIKGFVTSKALEKEFSKHNILFNSNIYVYTTEMMKSLVKEGVGIGWALKDTIKEEIENGILLEIPTTIETPKMTFSIVYDKRLINKTALTFAMFLEQNIKNDK